MNFIEKKISMKKIDKNLLGPCRILFVTFLYATQVSGQVMQNGVVTEISSGSKPIAGVSIIITNAPPVDSDANGHFCLNFRNAFPGDLLMVHEIYKKGYELINKNEINTWALSEKHTLTIVLARSGYIEEAKRKYYRIGVTAYQKKYQKILDNLSKEKEVQQLSEQLYRQKVDSLNNELQEFSLKLNIYADKFARINRDQLGDTEKKALALIDEGKIEEAIRIYEEMQLLHKMNERKEMRDNAMRNLEIMEQSLFKELQLLRKENEKGEYNIRIDSIYQVLSTSFPKDLSYKYSYAEWLLNCKQYDEALNIYNALLRFLTVSGDTIELNDLIEHVEKLKQNPQLKDSPKVKLLDSKIKNAQRILKYKTF